MIDEDAPISLALGKVIVAAAWADGEIQEEEVEYLRDVLFQMPSLTKTGWTELAALMESPIDGVTREHIISDFNNALKNEGDLNFALYALDQLILADGVVTDDEVTVANQIKAQLERNNLLAIDSMEEEMRETVNRRNRMIQERSQSVVDPVEHVLEFTPELEQESRRVSANTCRKLVLAGALVNRLLPTDSDPNADAIAHAFQKHWKLGALSAKLAAGASAAVSVRGLDVLRLCRLFYDETTDRERVTFINILFEIAQDQACIVEAEAMDEILNIAATIRLSHMQFQEAFVRACSVTGRL